MPRPDALRTALDALPTRTAQRLSDFTPLAARVVREQLRLARIAAPTGSEAERAARLMRVIAPLSAAAPGVRVEREPIGNVTCTIAGTAPALAPIVVAAHLDTVFDGATRPLARREGDRIVCPGIGDNARGLAALLALVGMVATTGRRRRTVHFVATVGEEGLGNLRGMRAHLDALERDGVRPAAVVALDGPGDDRVVHHAIGSRRYRIDVRGPGGHSWADFGRANAAHVIARAATWMAALPRALTGRAALTVTAIGGGEHVNGIPAAAWCEVDVRADDALLLQRLDRGVHEAVRAAVQDEPASSTLRADIVLRGERPAGRLDATHPLVRLAGAATAAIGRQPVSAIASTDANVPLARGIPAITIGAGGEGGGAHTPDEWYADTDGARGLARAGALLEVLADSGDALFADD